MRRAVLRAVHRCIAGGMPVPAAAARATLAPRCACPPPPFPHTNAEAISIIESILRLGLDKALSGQRV